MPITPNDPDYVQVMRSQLNAEQEYKKRRRQETKENAKLYREGRPRCQVLGDRNYQESNNQLLLQARQQIAVMEAIAGRPGQTVMFYSKATGISVQMVRRILRLLASDGVVIYVPLKGGWFLTEVKHETF